MGAFYLYPSELATMGTEVFSFDCCDGEQQDDPGDATEYPTDLGFVNTDGATIKASRFKFSGRVTATPLSLLLGIAWDQPARPGRPSAAYDVLKRLRDLRQPVAFTGRHMNGCGWITNLSKRSGRDTGNAIDVSVEIVEVRRSVPAFASIPPARLKANVKPQTAAKPAGGATGKTAPPKTAALGTVDALRGLFGKGAL